MLYYSLHLPVTQRADWWDFYQVDLEISELSCVNFQSRSIRSAAALQYAFMNVGPW